VKAASWDDAFVAYVGHPDAEDSLYFERVLG
jgi:hypothetical protein